MNFFLTICGKEIVNEILCKLESARFIDPYFYRRRFETELFCCVSCKNKEIVFRTRDANSAVNIRKLTRSWMETQTRPSEFSRKQCLSPVLEKTGKSKTIVVKTT